jgi:hypothetical protein
LSWYVVDGSTAEGPAHSLLTRLGIENDRPFVVILDRYIETERKFLSPLALAPRPPTAAEMGSLITHFLRGELTPVLLGQPRPAGDLAEGSAHLVEIVADSFDELVLDPHVDVLLETYTRTCDACKAFAPRYRMLADLVSKASEGGRGPRLRIARMDILDNDRQVAWLPEKTTPSLRLFPACGAGEKKSSVPLQHGGSANETMIQLPSLPALLSFVEANTGGRVLLTPALRARAEELEEVAVALESAYAACLRYMGLWSAYSGLVEEGRLALDETGGGGKDGERAEELKAAQACADEMRARVVEAYTFVVNEAGGEGLEPTLRRLDAVRAHVAKCSIAEVVEDAMAAAAERKT